MGLVMFEPCNKMMRRCALEILAYSPATAPWQQQQQQRNQFALLQLQTIISPMPGTLISVNVLPGQRLRPGDEVREEPHMMH